MCSGARRSGWPEGVRTRDETTILTGATFDFEVAGTGLRFERCRYYGLTARDGGGVSRIDIGISPRRLNWAELQEEPGQTDQAEERRLGPWARGQSAL